MTEAESLFLRLFLVSEVKYTYVTYLKTLSVTAEGDVSLLVEHSGMVPVVNSVRIVIGTVRCHVVTLASCADVAVHYDLAVDSNLDMVTLDTDFFGAPFAKGLVDDPLCRDYTIH